MSNNERVVIFSKKQIKNLDIIKILHKYGFIQGFEFRGNYIFIYLHYIYNKTFQLNNPFISISTIKRYKNCSSISSKKWEKINKLTGEAICYIISTDQGLKTGYFYSKIGGIPLIKAL